MKHTGTKTIETDRLILRKALPEDALPMYENWASDPEVTRHLTWPTYTDVQTAQDRVAFLLEQYSREDVYEWFIVSKEEMAPIGSIGVVAWDSPTESAEVGYCIGRSWWHQGIVSEALEAVITFLFEEVGMNRVEARHAVNNPHSGGVMKKCGMIFEGISRESFCSKQGLCDMAHYAILKKDLRK